MIITCPSCNRRFDLQRRPPKQFRCPKCGFTTAFSEVLNNGGNNKEQNITLNEEAAAAMGIGAGPVPNTNDIAPATPGTLGASTTLAQPTGGNASLPTGVDNKTRVVAGLQPAMQGPGTKVVRELQLPKKAYFDMVFQGMPAGSVMLPASGQATVGRNSSDSNAQLKLTPDIAMSRIHAAIRVTQNGPQRTYQITSAKNENPVYVNSKPIKQGQAVTLQPGDKLQMGYTLLTFRLG